MCVMSEINFQIWSSTMCITLSHCTNSATLIHCQCENIRQWLIVVYDKASICGTMFQSLKEKICHLPFPKQQKFKFAKTNVSSNVLNGKKSSCGTMVQSLKGKYAYHQKKKRQNYFLRNYASELQERNVTSPPLKKHVPRYWILLTLLLCYHC